MTVIFILFGVVAIIFILFGVFMVVLIGRGLSMTATNRRAMEEARLPLQRLRGEVVEGITYADTYLDLLPPSGEREAARQQRQDAAGLLEQAKGFARAARKPEDYGRAQALLEQAKNSADACRASAESSARRQCRISHRGFAEIFQRARRKGAPAHLRRSIQRQQGIQCKWRPGVDSKGRRLLERVRQAAEGVIRLP